MVKVESRKGIEDILADQGLLTPDQLSAVKFEHVNTGKSTEAILVERRYISPKDLARARAELLGVPFVELGQRYISTQILDLIPEPVANKYKLIPFHEENGVLHVAMADPLDLQVIEFLEKRAGLKVTPFLAEEDDIRTTIEEQYSKSLGSEVSAALKEAAGSTTKIEEHIKDLEKAEETLRDAPVARIVATLLEYAVKARASDVHIEPMEDKTRVRYRIDGILQERLTLPKKVHASVISRIKILADMKIDERRIPQDGRFKVSVGSAEVDLRVSTLPTVFGEKVVIRLLKEEGKLLNLPELGLRGTALKRMEEGLLKPTGVIFVTGPTGSGKTVTLASCLSKVSSVRVNIFTVEDPVEIRIAGASQVQINPQAGLTFASGLRSILRQDPDIIMVGEVRDSETAQLAIQAALTGHLVLSTLHTNSAVGALPRLLDMGVEAYLLISSVNTVLAQRLVRRICPKCVEQYEAPREVTADFQKILGPLYDQKMKALGRDKLLLSRGHGCDECERLGYSGRTGIFEVFNVSEKVARLVLEHRTSDDLQKIAVEEGMVTLIQDGYLKAMEGLTTLEEVLRVARD